jgi:hypothetical protein
MDGFSSRPPAAPGAVMASNLDPCDLYDVRAMLNTVAAYFFYFSTVYFTPLDYHSMWHSTAAKTKDRQQ